MVRDIEARGILDMSTEWLPVRERNMIAGIHPTMDTPADGFAYTAVQELLTKFAHFDTSRLMDAPGRSNLLKIGGDEGRHYNVYGSGLKALAAIFPDIALAGMRRQHEGGAFAMPGQKGIPNYIRLARTIALAGVFDTITVLEAQKQTILETKLLEAEPVTDQGKLDQEWAHGITSEEDPVWENQRAGMIELRERAGRRIKPGRLRPFIIGVTVELDANNNYVPIAA